MNYVEPEVVRRAIEAVAAAAKEPIYHERNQIAALLARMALALGWRAGVGRKENHVEQDWRTVLLIDLPTGQVSWHFHDSERDLLAGLPEYSHLEFDGHGPGLKYDRVNKALRQQQSLNQREMQRCHEENQLGELESLAKEYGWRGMHDDLTLRGFFRRALEAQCAAEAVRQQQLRGTILQALANAPMQRKAERCRFAVEGAGQCVRKPGHHGVHEFASGAVAYRCSAYGEDFKGIHAKGRCLHALGHDGDHDFAEVS